jgi:hypothetical protein
MAKPSLQLKYSEKRRKKIDSKKLEKIYWYALSNPFLSPIFNIYV